MRIARLMTAVLVAGGLAAAATHAAAPAQTRPAMPLTGPAGQVVGDSHPVAGTNSMTLVKAKFANMVSSGTTSYTAPVSGMALLVIKTLGPGDGCKGSVDTAIVRPSGQTQPGVSLAGPATRAPQPHRENRARGRSLEAEPYDTRFVLQGEDGLFGWSGFLKKGGEAEIMIKIADDEGFCFEGGVRVTWVRVDRNSKKRVDRVEGAIVRISDGVVEVETTAPRDIIVIPLYQVVNPDETCVFVTAG